MQGVRLECLIAPFRLESRICKDFGLLVGWFFFFLFRPADLNVCPK